jgi:hypothetical protein
MPHPHHGLAVSETSMATRKPVTDQAPDSDAETSHLQREASELRKRIERLEERIETSILGDDGLAERDKATLDKGIDKRASGDPLERAVRRSNIKRGSRKAD